MRHSFAVLLTFSTYLGFHTLYSCGEHIQIFFNNAVCFQQNNESVSKEIRDFVCCSTDTRTHLTLSFSELMLLLLTLKCFHSVPSVPVLVMLYKPGLTQVDLRHVLGMFAQRIMKSLVILYKPFLSRCLGSCC